MPKDPYKMCKLIVFPFGSNSTSKAKLLLATLMMDYTPVPWFTLRLEGIAWKVKKNECKQFSSYSKQIPWNGNITYHTADEFSNLIGCLLIYFLLRLWLQAVPIHYRFHRFLIMYNYCYSNVSLRCLFGFSGRSLRCRCLFSLIRFLEQKVTNPWSQHVYSWVVNTVWYLLLYFFTGAMRSE